MSASTIIVMIPPPGEAPSLLQLGANVSLTPDTSGHFAVPAAFVGQMLAAGWQIVIATPTNVPHVP